MSRMYDALTKAQHEQEQSARRESQGHHDLPRCSNGTKPVAVPSERLKAHQGDLPPLFLSDTVENFRLWMQSCFPDGSFPREDAIRKWLDTPLEIRVQRGYSSRSEPSKPN